jgi:hypothetical protein
MYQFSNLDAAISSHPMLTQSPEMFFEAIDTVNGHGYGCTG